MSNANELQQNLNELADLAIAARDANALGATNCMEGNIAAAIEVMQDVAHELRFEM